MSKLLKENWDKLDRGEKFDVIRESLVKLLKVGEVKKEKPKKVKKGKK